MLRAKPKTLCRRLSRIESERILGCYDALHGSRTFLTPTGPAEQHAYRAQADCDSSAGDRRVPFGPRSKDFRAKDREALGFGRQQDTGTRA